MAEGQVIRLLIRLRYLHCEYYLMEWQVGRLSDIQWDGNLVHMLELREVSPIGCQVVMVLDKLRVQHCKSHLVQNMELRRDIPRACQNVMLRAKLGSLQGYLTRLQGWK